MFSLTIMNFSPVQTDATLNTISPENYAVFQTTIFTLSMAGSASAAVRAALEALGATFIIGSLV